MMTKLEAFLKQGGTGTYAIKLTLGASRDKLESASGKNLHITLKEKDPYAANNAICSFVTGEAPVSCEITGGLGDPRYKKMYIRV